MPSRQHRCGVAGFVVAVLALVALGLLGAPGAHAHDRLVGSSPEQGASVVTPPSEVVLEFNTSIGEQFTQVAVVGQDGSSYEAGDPVVEGATVTQAVEGLPDAGDVTISYRVVSSDGHPIGGTVAFTIAGGSGSVPDGQATPTRAASEQGTSDEDGVAAVVWVAAGALVLVLAAAALALIRRRSRTSIDG